MVEKRLSDLLESFSEDSHGLAIRNLRKFKGCMNALNDQQRLIVIHQLSTLCANKKLFSNNPKSQVLIQALLDALAAQMSDQFVLKAFAESDIDSDQIFV